ncbi:MAG: TROVE domain-containing protein, partial [bacterium]|nr:TROVE domain-containing protein [bacterium]
MGYYLTKVVRKTVPRPEPLPPVTDWTRLERFLILGNENGSYHAGERSLTLDNAGAVKRCLAEEGVRAVNTIAGVSESGRAPNNDPALFALAMAASSDDEETRQAALAALSRVARTGTHLLRFAAYVDGMRGWGRGLRRAVARWYVEQPLEQVAYQVTQHRRRDGWSHRDLLRMAHPKADDERDALFQWVVKGRFGAKRPAEPERSELRVVEAMERLHGAGAPAEVAALVQIRGLTREMVPPDFLNEREVWEALLERMPLPVMLHSLAALTRAGALTPTSEATTRVTARLRSGWAIRKAMLHPVAVLAAMLAYKAGRGVDGRQSWSPAPEVVAALEDAFQLAFANVPATGKRHYVAVDASGSMGSGEVGGVAGLTPRMAAAAIAMTFVRA